MYHRLDPVGITEHAADMDLYKAIRQLYEERAKLDRLIATLEEFQKKGPVSAHGGEGVKRRGRKTMGEEERRDVSERMKQYWASRKGSPEEPSA